VDCNYYHVAFLVADIDEAIANFSRVLQVEFNPPDTLSSPMEWHGQRIEQDMRVTYSTTAPYIELIEAHPDGYFSIEQGEGFHHLGMWAPDRDSPEWRERFQELILEAHMLGRGMDLTDPASCHGVRLELVPAANKAGTLGWIHRDGSTP
jgi:hypothetical protein